MSTKTPINVCESCISDLSPEDQRKIAENTNFAVSGSDDQKCCSVCFGLFNEQFAQQVSSQVVHKLQSENYDTLDSFQLSVSAPLSCVLRKAILCVLGAQSNKNGVEEKLKEDLRSLYSSRLQTALEVPCLGVGNFSISVEFSCNAIEESDKLFLQSELGVQLPKKEQPSAKKRKLSEKSDSDSVERVLTKAKMFEAVQLLNFSSAQKYAWEQIPENCQLSIVFTREPIYLAGRYCKYSRFLPQSPWFTDGGERIGDSSVSEIITQPITKAFEAESNRFMSSGREDIDVRMMGNGRPFAVQVISPKTLKMLGNLEELTRIVNCASQDVVIDRLVAIDKNQMEQLKAGEEEKTKQYVALCSSPHSISAELLSKLSQMESVELSQKTPVRVLKRRPLATRQRTVSNISALVSGDKTFMLQLTTQAGTYVKEFVHSDFGRTQPSLGELLGLEYEFDIVELDVIGIDLEWPPCDKSE